MSVSRIVLRVYLVRHGETEENRLGITQGQMNTVLNEIGLLEAEETGRALEDVVFTQAFSSDLTRAIQTAEAITTLHPGVHVEDDELLRNRYKGDPIESLEALQERLIHWWEASVESRLPPLLQTGSDPENILAVSHHACILSLLDILSEKGKIKEPLGLVKGECWNASVTIIEIQADGIGVLRQHCDISHLGNIYDINYYNSDNESSIEDS